MRAKTLSAVLVLLAACGPQVPVSAPRELDLAAEAIRGEASRPPPGPAEACWGRDTIPAVIETETVTRQVSPDTYRSESRQRMLRDTETVWVRTPCYDQLTPDTIATLQRALRARGYYLGALDGALTPETMTAMRRFQAEHGLDTKILSLRAAQMLGLVATPL